MAGVTARGIGTASALSGEAPTFCSTACADAVSVINKMAALIGRISPPIHLTLLWQGGSYWHINGSVPRELDHNGSVLYGS